MAKDKIRTLTLLVVFLLAFPLFLQAQSKPCGSGGNETQAELNQCAVDEFHAADKRLNQTYKELLDKLRNDKIAQKKLIAAQRAWIAFRDAELEALWPIKPGENPNFRYGSVHPFCYYEELAAMTDRRTDELRDRMSNQEGNVCALESAKCVAQPSGKRQYGY